MPIKPIYSEKEKPAWVYDHKQKRWKGYLLDTYKSAGVGRPLKRVRIQFARRADAERAELEIEIEKKNELLGIVRAKDKRPITLRELFDRHQSTYQHKHRKQLAARVYESFLANLPPHILVSELKPAHFHLYAERRLKQVKAKTVNHELSVIAPALKAAYLYFPELEDFQTPFVPKLKGANSRRTRLVTGDEKAQLIEYLARGREIGELEKNYAHRVRLAHWIEFKALTGFRRKEIAALEKASYDRAQRALINVWRYKTNKATQFFPLTLRAAEIIEERLKLDSASKFIFTPDGKPIESNYRTLKEVCRHLNINYGRETAGGFVLHDLKRNFATELQQVADIATLRELTSNSSNSLGVYLNTSREQMRDAIAKLERRDFRAELLQLFDAVENGEIDRETFVQKVKNMFL